MPFQLLNASFLIYILLRILSDYVKMLVRFVLYGSKEIFFALLIWRTICWLCQQNTIAQYNKENPSIWTKVILTIPIKDEFTLTNFTNKNFALVDQVHLTQDLYQWKRCINGPSIINPLWYTYPTSFSTAEVET